MEDDHLSLSKRRKKRKRKRPVSLQQTHSDSQQQDFTSDVSIKAQFNPQTVPGPSPENTTVVPSQQTEESSVSSSSLNRKKEKRKRWKQKKKLQQKLCAALGPSEAHRDRLEYCFEGSSSGSVDVVPQLCRTGKASAVKPRSGATLNGKPSSNQWTQKNKKWLKNLHQTVLFDASKDNNRTVNDADFSLSRTVQLHPHTSNDVSEGMSSQFTAVTHPQVNSTVSSNCETTTSTLKLFTANGQRKTPPSSANVPGSAKACKPTAAVPSKCLAIDCEMVGAGPRGHISQVARCSIVSYHGDLVFDRFIKPPLPVTDYRTRWSGIRPRDLHRATPFAEARAEILRLVKGKVLIGHAIHNDLKVLNYSHPKNLTRDTSRIPLLNAKAGFGEREVVSLKRLTKALFNRDIQTGRRGHSPVEDAKATMELYKVVEVEWEQTLASTSDKHQGENK